MLEKGQAELCVCTYWEINWVLAGKLPWAAFLSWLWIVTHDIWGALCSAAPAADPTPVLV